MAKTQEVLTRAQEQLNYATSRCGNLMEQLDKIKNHMKWNRQQNELNLASNNTDEIEDNSSTEETKSTISDNTSNANHKNTKAFLGKDNQENSKNINNKQLTDEKKMMMKPLSQSSSSYESVDTNVSSSTISESEEEEKLDNILEKEFEERSAEKLVNKNTIDIYSGKIDESVQSQIELKHEATLVKDSENLSEAKREKVDSNFDSSNINNEKYLPVTMAINESVGNKSDEYEECEEVNEQGILFMNDYVGSDEEHKEEYENNANSNLNEQSHVEAQDIALATFSREPSIEEFFMENIINIDTEPSLNMREINDYKPDIVFNEESYQLIYDEMNDEEFSSQERVTNNDEDRDVDEVEKFKKQKKQIHKTSVESKKKKKILPVESDKNIDKQKFKNNKIIKNKVVDVLHNNTKKINRNKGKSEMINQIMLNNNDMNELVSPCHKDEEKPNTKRVNVKFNIEGISINKNNARISSSSAKVLDNTDIIKSGNKTATLQNKNNIQQKNRLNPAAKDNKRMVSNYDESKKPNINNKNLKDLKIQKDTKTANTNRTKKINHVLESKQNDQSNKIISQPTQTIFEQQQNYGLSTSQVTNMKNPKLKNKVSKINTTKSKLSSVVESKVDMENSSTVEKSRFKKAQNMQKPETSSRNLFENIHKTIKEKINKPVENNLNRGVSVQKGTTENRKQINDNSIPKNIVKTKINTIELNSNNLSVKKSQSTQINNNLNNSKMNKHVKINNPQNQKDTKNVNFMRNNLTKEDSRKISNTKSSNKGKSAVRNVDENIYENHDSDEVLDKFYNNGPLQSLSTHDFIKPSKKIHKVESAQVVKNTRGVPDLLKRPGTENIKPAPKYVTHTKPIKWEENNNMANEKPFFNRDNFPNKTVMHNLTSNVNNNNNNNNNNNSKENMTLAQSLGFNAIPFIVGQSTSRSYHIGLNIQQTMSLMKHSPSMPALKLEMEPNYMINNNFDRTSSAGTGLTNTSYYKVKTCPACAAKCSNNNNDYDEENEEDMENPDDPWFVPQKDSWDKQNIAKRKKYRCTCLPRNVITFNEVLNQLFQNDGLNQIKSQTSETKTIYSEQEEDQYEKENRRIIVRPNNAFYFTRLLRNIQRIQDQYMPTTKLSLNSTKYNTL